MAATYSPTTQCSTIGDAVCGRLCRLSAAPLRPCALRARERAHRTPHTVRHRRHRARLRSRLGDVKRRLDRPGHKRYGLSQKRKYRAFLFSSTSERGSHKKKSIKILTPIYKTRGGVRGRAHYARGKALVSVADCVDRRRTGLVGVRKRGMALVYGLFARVSDEYSRGLRGLRALYFSVA